MCCTFYIAPVMRGRKHFNYLAVQPLIVVTMICFFFSEDTKRQIDLVDVWWQICMFYHSHVNKDIFFDPRFRPYWILQPLFFCLCIMSHLRQMLRCGAGVTWIGKDFPVELQLKKRYFKDLSFPQWLRLFLSWNLLLLVVAVLSILCFFFAMKIK